MYNNEELITIVIPVYNVEKYLDRCINSVINQTYSNLEIILVDDGSTDSCPKICDEYEKKDKRIKVIHKENEGVSSARNIGLKNATGNYITFVDSDDTITEDYIKVILENLNSEEILIFNYILKKNKNTRVNYCNLNKITGIDDELINSLIRYHLLNSVTNKVYKKEIIDKYNLHFREDIICGEDFIFNLDYLTKIKTAKIIKKPLYYYYQNEKSIMHKKKGNKLEQQRILNDYMYELFIKYKYDLSYMKKLYIDSIYSVIRFNIIHNIPNNESLKEIKEYVEQSKIMNIDEKSKLSLYDRLIYYMICKKKFKSVYNIIKFKVKIKEFLKRILNYL